MSFFDTRGLCLPRRYTAIGLWSSLTFGAFAKLRKALLLFYFSTHKLFHKSHDVLYEGFQLLKTVFCPSRRGMIYVTSLSAWRMDQQSSGNCLATKVTRFITLDFFLWRYVKNLVHKVRNHDLQQLKARIRKAEFTVTHNKLQNAWTEARINWKLIVQPVVPTLNLLG